MDNEGSMHEEQDRADPELAAEIAANIDASVKPNRPERMSFERRRVEEALIVFKGQRMKHGRKGRTQQVNTKVAPWVRSALERIVELEAKRAPAGAYGNADFIEWAILQWEQAQGGKGK